jgi:hypothetical protein
MKIKDLINKSGLFILPLVGGWLGAFGGADGTSKAWRRILIPGLLTSYAFSNTSSVFVITIMSMAGALSIGYGIPSETDSGSTLGRFFYKLFKNNHLLADLATRGTIGKLIALSLVSIPIIKGNWITYLLGSLGIVLINSLISWRNFGEYTLFEKKLSWVETITWGLITLCGVIIIYF